MKYGELELISREGDVYTLRCSCGNTVVRRAASLSRARRKKSIISCGCITKKANPAYVGFKSQLVRDGYKCYVSQKEYEKILSHSCYYCNSPDVKVRLLDYDKDALYSNVISICHNCDRIKGRMNHLDFLSWLNRLLTTPHVKHFGIAAVALEKPFPPKDQG